MGIQGRILVIDDNVVMLNQIRARLSSEGYDVAVSPHPTPPLATLRDRDLVIIDFHMPGVDTPKAIANLRKLAENSNSPCKIYLYTTDRSEAISFKQHGCDGVFMLKGDAEALASQVRAAFRMIRLQQFAGGDVPPRGSS